MLQKAKRALLLTRITHRKNDTQHEWYLTITLFVFWSTTNSTTSFGYFFARCVIFVRYHFLWVSCLSISSGVFVTCHFRKVPLFSNGIKALHLCWAYLMVVKLQLFTVLQVLWKEISVVIKHEIKIDLKCNINVNQGFYCIFLEAHINVGLYPLSGTICIKM